MAIVKRLAEKWSPLGQTGLTVSPIGLGTVKFGRNIGVKNKMADGFRLPTDKEISALLEQALNLGINILDTAPAYGTSEEVLGRNLLPFRDKFVISTKVGEEFADGISTYDFSEEHVRNSIERSLRRLRVDHIDSVLIHCPREDLAVLRDTPVLATLARLKDEGKIRSFGASTKSVAGGLFAVEQCDTVMVSFNLLYQDELPVIQRAMELGRGIFVIKALLQGHLDRVVSSDPTTACLRAVYEASPGAVVVVGTLSPQHLADNVAAAERALSENISPI